MEYNVNGMYNQSNGFYDQTQKTKDKEESKLAMKASEGSISMSNNDTPPTPETPPSPVSWPYPGTPPSPMTDD